ncbi:MAG: T9SS type A sorting domain-containing protein [Bacteroidia bacterium]|nr:T9SS type A sorting domain-containing protein [Bacteroidia bacterium]
MKKHLLITTGILAGGILSAQVARVAKIPANLANQKLLKSAVVDEKITPQQMKAIQKAKAISAHNKKVAAYSETPVGFTNYDLQSNGSVGDRIVVNADGSIALCWTSSAGDGGSYADRGTGYNYYNGTAWAVSGPFNSGNTSRVENVRVGWGNVVNTRNGKEAIMAHGAGNSSLNIATRATKGTGTWNNSTTALPNITGGNWWPRMVTSHPTGGDTIYSISITYPVANGGAAYNGLDGALLFSRSTDGGITWDIQNTQPNGLTSTEFLGFSGDGYAIAARGATVAIIAGDSGTDLVLSKSTDGGNTWTSSIVLDFPVNKWDPTTTISDIDNDGIADTVETNDGNLSIAVDNNGKAFVAYGRMRILNDAPSANGYSYFPYTDGLYIWNESMPTQTVSTVMGTNIAAGMEDLYQQGTIYFPTVASGSWPFGLTRANSLTSFPSLAFDAANTLYLSYSSVVDSCISITGDKLVRHQYITKSTDEGVNWECPYDIVPFAVNAEQEGIYGSLAKNVNSDAHIIYQRDFYPGNGIPAASGTNPDGIQLDQGNDMIYVKVPTSDIGNNCSVPTGIKNSNSPIASVNVYPNPAQTSATIEVQLTDNAKLDVVILNAVGQTVYTTSTQANAGLNTVALNISDLSAGIYFYQVKIGNGYAVTKKFVVNK